MALSRERIADELLKLLGMAEPSSTVQVMLERGILKPVIPEIRIERVASLDALIATEREARVEPHALRRLASLLPRDAHIAADIATRLRFSNKAKKRLACSAIADLGSSARALAYDLGTECAVDRLLLAGRASEAAEMAAWKPPRLPIGGGDLIARGLPEGPIVAKTLKAIERKWVEAGFPAGDAFERMVAEALRGAL